MTTAQEIFAQVDRLDPEGVIAFFADDATMVFGNQEPLLGREAILAGNAAFLTAIKGLRHRILREWTVGDTTIVVTDVSYVRRDDKGGHDPGGVDLAGGAGRAGDRLPRLL